MNLREPDLSADTSLIGRADDLAAIERIMREGARLITLTGPPGIGKTRLGGVVADRVAARTVDGVAVVSLAAVRDADLVASAIGQAVGIVEIAGQPLVDTLVHYLQSRRMLLLLDRVTPAAAPVIAALLT